LANIEQENKEPPIYMGLLVALVCVGFECQWFSFPHTISPAAFLKENVIKSELLLKNYVVNFYFYFLFF